MFRLITSLRYLLAGIMLVFAAGSTASAQGYNDDTYGDQGSYQQFYDELSPYGEWVNDPDYGYVWVPDAGDDFRPYYSNGHWVNSDYGNTWVSDYDWGWAPFHYGRWTYSNYYGWLWVPGNEWGPAWVSWRSGGGSYGWAPLGPGVSINVAIGGGYYAPNSWWTFTPQQYILNPGFRNYCYGPRYNQRYVQQTTIINNTYVYNRRTYLGGPRRDDLQRAIGRPVQTVAINNNRRPQRSELRGNTLSLYRPAIVETRPRSSERPRSFTAVRQPIAESTTRAPRVTSGQGIDRGSVRPGFRDRNNMSQQQSVPAQQQAEPVRNGWGTRPAEPRQERPRLDPVMQVPQQQRPDRRIEQRQPQTAQPAQRPREWNNVNRAPDPVQIQQPQRQERPTFNRGAEMQRPVQRPQEVQRPQPQQRFERPAPVQQQPQMQRPEPRMQQAQPQQAPRMERPQGGRDNGSFRR